MRLTAETLAAASVDLFGISKWESFLGQSDIPVENSLAHTAQ
jgi:hypothetical protein